ncbi:MAG TPA: carboxypeptidase-like regulatory domain-containing protein [Chitinophagaceae bacterium]|nr:carboxypeptidase-like regulatory domain-containing protein [Chitinophagaceae bacterium]
MATDKNIKNYTAADIEKYHKGLLSATERHDLEKAALDDPFLADALEGYSTKGVNIQADIAELSKRLQDRTEKAKVIPIGKGGSRSFPLLRVAAIIILLLTAGLLVYKFGFNKKENELAKLEKSKNKETTSSDSSGSLTDSNTISGLKKATENTATGNAESSTVKQDINRSEPEKRTEGQYKTDDNLVKEKAAEEKNDLATVNNPVSKAPVAADKEQQKDVANNDDKSMKTSDVTILQEKAENDEVKTKQYNANAGITKPGNASRKADGNYRNTATNIFRGRVTDSRNAGIPFANVMNIADNVATYTDANGYFNLINPDTVLNVQVRSIGFENDTVKLKNNVASNKIIMQEDQKTVSAMVLSHKQSNAISRSRNAKQYFEEPEPADGWRNYDAYLANNLNVPEDFEMKTNPEVTVEVSFEVNQLGEPINIRIEKSLCSACDKEAIRLIKEGPKWRRNANKNGRTTVTISF